MASTVAVLMRTRDRGLLLRRAIADVCAQTYPHWRLFLINDGGAVDEVDRLVGAQAGLGGRVTILHNPEPVGRAAAWNQGVAAGDSDYIAVHDDDDTWHPTFLERTVHHLDTTRDAAVAVRTEIVRERVEGDRVLEQEREIWEPSVRSVTLFELLRSNRFVPIQMLYRRSVHDELGGVRADLPVVEDWEFNLRLAANRPVGFLEGEPLAFWHQRWEEEGTLANSVAAVQEEHREADLRLRDEALRAYVHEHGMGGVLYVTKYLQREFELMHERLTRDEGGLHEVLDLLRGVEERATAQQEAIGALEATIRQQAEQLSRQSEQVARLEAAISDASLVSLVRRRYRRLKDRLTR
jgi:glycosyltransferase involved in cell wall biosynthesis